MDIKDNPPRFSQMISSPVPEKSVTELQAYINDTKLPYLRSNIFKSEVGSYFRLYRKNFPRYLKLVNGEEDDLAIAEEIAEYTLQLGVLDSVVEHIDTHYQHLFI